MKLYIQVENGKPVNHPALESNLIESLGSIPNGWEQFVRIAPPKLGAYEKNQTVTYQKVKGVWTDVFSCEQMTSEEIIAKQEAVKAAWVERASGFDSWTFDETLCCYVAPEPMPKDGNPYMWRESDQSWVFMPAAPLGEGWTFNIETTVWEKV